jgi:thioredoxin-like negative regulator of GroEL
MKGQEWIDNFLENSEERPLITSVVEDEEDEKTEKIVEESDDESYFTETLAKIYVKQQRYSKALEIITRLNLKYPEKNAYFADQIRFLEKLIINSKQK